MVRLNLTRGVKNQLLTVALYLAMLAQPTTYEHIPRQPGPSQPITNQASQFSLIAPAQPVPAQPCQTAYASLAHVAQRAPG